MGRIFRRNQSEPLSSLHITKLDETKTSELFSSVLANYVQGRIIPLLGDLGRSELLKKDNIETIRTRISSVVYNLISNSTLSYDDKKEILLSIAEKNRFSTGERARSVIIKFIQAVLIELGISSVRYKNSGKRELIPVSTKKA